MDEQFKFAGMATINHINARKEGPDDEKELAVDIKLQADVGADVLDMLGEGLRDFLFLPGGAVRNVMLGPVTFRHEMEHYRLETLGSVHHGVKVKKLSVEPKDSYVVTLTFSLSFKPSGDEVARMAEYLQDAIDLDLQPANEELDLGGAK